MSLKWIKKVAATPLSQIAKVVDSIAAQDNDRINAPSIRAVREALNVSWDQVYPVGAIYMTINSDDPSVLFGGTWQRIKDRFLLAAGDTYSNGSTGGSATHIPLGSVGSHTLTESEIPAHKHGYSYYTSYTTAAEGGDILVRTEFTTETRNTDNTGGGLGHNHSFTGSATNTMPPYLTVNVWTRTA